jgi:hypothetical protein
MNPLVAGRRDKRASLSGALEIGFRTSEKQTLTEGRWSGICGLQAEGRTESLPREDP